MSPRCVLLYLLIPSWCVSQFDGWWFGWWVEGSTSSPKCQDFKARLPWAGSKIKYRDNWTVSSRVCWVCGVFQWALSSEQQFPDVVLYSMCSMWNVWSMESMYWNRLMQCSWKTCTQTLTTSLTLMLPWGASQVPMQSWKICVTPHTDLGEVKCCALLSNNFATLSQCHIFRNLSPYYNHIYRCLSWQKWSRPPIGSLVWTAWTCAREVIS